MAADNYGAYPPPMGGFQRKVTFQEAIKMGFDKYATFSGRSSRSEYWWWVVFTILIGLVTGALDTVLGTEIVYDEVYGQPQTIGIISTIVSLGLIVPGLAICWRRLHDIGKAGGWYFIWFIPLIGWIILIVWFATDSEMQENRFGEIPNWVDIK